MENIYSLIPECQTNFVYSKPHPKSIHDVLGISGRIVRAGRDRVDVSLLKKTKDGVKVRVKPLLLTRFNTHKSARRDLKKKCEEFFDKLLKNLDYTTFVSELISNKVHVEMKQFLNKTYPLGGVEIRAMKKIEK